MMCLLFVWQYVNEVDGHRAPLADLLNQLSSSSDCCRAMHFITIGDSDDSASSDNEMSNENGSVGTGALSDERSAAADDVASLPAVGIPSADSLASVDGFSVRGLSGTSTKDDCRVQCSQCDAVSSSPPTSSARNGHGSAIAEDYSQQFGE